MSTGKSNSYEFTGEQKALHLFGQKDKWKKKKEKKHPVGTVRKWHKR